jgi:hypothetical protein
VAASEANMIAAERTCFAKCIGAMLRRLGQSGKPLKLPQRIVTRFAHDMHLGVIPPRHLHGE